MPSPERKKEIFHPISEQAYCKVGISR